MNSKAKGSGAERDTARFLTRWISGQDKELYFWRTPGSGFMSTVGNHANFSGDINPVKEEVLWMMKYNIEIKNGYSKVDLFQLLKGNKNFELASFWKQCTEDSEKHEKIPILLFKKKGGKYIIGINQELANILINKLNGLACIAVNFTDLPMMLMYNRDEFFNNIKPGDLK